MIDSADSRKPENTSVDVAVSNSDVTGVLTSPKASSGVMAAGPDDPAAPLADSVDNLTSRVARGSSWVLVGSAIARVIQFGLHILLSRGLGASSYGLYAMGRSVMHFMQQFGGLGLPAGIVRFGASQHGKGDDSALKGTLIASLLIGSFASTIIAIILFMGADWISVRVFNESAFASVLRIFSVSLPFFVLNFLASRAARAAQMMKHDVVIGSIAQPSVNFVLVAIAFSLGFGLGGAIYAFLIATIISALAGFYLVVRLFPVLFSSLQPVFAVRKLMKYSLTVLGAGISTLLLGETDRLMLGMLASSTEVGVYNVAVLVSTQMVFFLTAINSSFMPMIADLYHRNCYSQLHEIFRTTTRWVVIFSLPLFLVLLLFPAPVLAIFGAEFTAAAPALTILAIAYFVDAGVGSVGFLLQMSDYHHILAINNVIMAVLNILLNYWLIQEYGITGAAIATAIAISTINLVKLIEVRILLGMHPYDRTYLKPVIAGVLAALVGLSLLHFVDLSWTWMLGIVGVVGAYGGFLYILRPEEQDVAALKDLLSKRLSALRENGRSRPPER